MLTRSARVIERDFNERLAAAGGSVPIWLILISLKSGGSRNQNELAQIVGIRGPTLTHHLNGMESAGLVTRQRQLDNRRMHVVEMTEAGSTLFTALREVAMSFDHTLRAGIEPDDLATFIQVLTRMYANVVGRDSMLSDFQPVRPAEPTP
jgi:MarR family transcriptional regulator for hemolysin